MATTKGFYLYDTLTRETYSVVPGSGKGFTVYCCGPTVYGPAHIGNFRTFVNVDVLIRVLKLAGLRPVYVRNITDVEDKTIKQSQAEGVPLAEFTRRWTERFHADCAALNLLVPDVEPEAVAHIEDQIRLIENLVNAEHAYVAEDGSVYFNIASYPEYGRLSRLADRETTTQKVSSDEYEGAAADFALWKARKPEDGPNYWDSPWGQGRPGWHIECSAMAHKHLGNEFDLHCGGMDLIFPHHENEIAQSCAGGCGPFARHWWHGAHLKVDGGKMSKSLGNLYTLEDIQARGYSPVQLRWLLIGGHYRKPLDFTLEQLENTVPVIERMVRFEAALRATGPLPETFDPLADAGVDREAGSFGPAWEALLEDLNVPKALGQLFTAMKPLEKALRQGDAVDGLREWQGFHTILYALGIELPEIEEPGQVDIPEAIQALAESRWQARLNKDWSAADAGRDELAAKGWKVLDGKDGYELTPMEPSS